MGTALRTNVIGKIDMRKSTFGPDYGLVRQDDVASLSGCGQSASYDWGGSSDGVCVHKRGDRDLPSLGDFLIHLIFASGSGASTSVRAIDALSPTRARCVPN